MTLDSHRNVGVPLSINFRKHPAVWSMTQEYGCAGDGYPHSMAMPLPPADPEPRARPREAEGRVAIPQESSQENTQEHYQYLKYYIAQIKYIL